MGSTQLTRIDKEKKNTRFYRCQVLPTLFGDWMLIREWGQVGQGRHQERRDWFDDETQACAALNKILARKKRKGYQAAV